MPVRPSHTGPELLDLARAVVDQAGPGVQAEAYVARGVSTTVKAYDGEVESLESAQYQGVGVRVIVDHRQGFAWAASLDPEVVAGTLAEAQDNARFAEPDEHVALVEPDGVAPPEIDTYRPALESFPVDAKVAFAVDLEAAVRAGDPRITGVRTAMYGDSLGEAALVSTAGIQAATAGTSCYLSVSALANDGTETQIGGGVDVAREPAELVIDDAASDAVDRATRMLGATKPASARVTVVFDPRVAASFWGIIGGMLTGDAVLKGRSPFADRLGEVVAAPAVTLVEDPTDVESLNAGRYDGEGLACRRTDLIGQGRLLAFLHNSYTARRAGAVSTASAARGYRSTPVVAPRALAITPGTADRDEVLAAVGEGLFIQSVSGLHSGVNPVSGDFSVGAEGLMIRNGELAEPVREMTIASTLQRMLTDVVVVGGDVEVLPSGTRSVSVGVAGVSMSGT